MRRDVVCGRRGEGKGVKKDARDEGGGVSGVGEGGRVMKQR